MTENAQNRGCRARKSFEQALKAHRAGHLEEAIRSYTESLALNPDQPQTYNNMGVALRAAGTNEVVQHGAALGIGIASMASEDDELYEELKS